MKIRGLFISALLLVACFPSLGGGFPTSFLFKVSSSRVTMNYEFDAVKGDKLYSGSGIIRYQDKAYVLETEGLKVCDDLSVNVTVNFSSREVVKEASNACDFFSDPSSILRIIGLNPKKATVDVKMSEGADSFTVTATLSDGMSIQVDVKGIRFSAKGPLSDFGFDTSSLDSAWMVTDLR